jgi:hypothetical protein
VIEWLFPGRSSKIQEAVPILRTIPRLRSIILGIGFLAVTGTGPSAATLTRSVVGSGGGAAVQGSFRLNATTGQPAAGRSYHASAFHGAGFWFGFTPVSTGVGPAGWEAQPLALRFFPNAPNPFRELTRIRYQLPRSEHVRLRVLDVRGRRLATLVDERLGPGTHEAVFRSGGLAPGVYFYRLRAGSEVRTGRMILAK